MVDPVSIVGIVGSVAALAWQTFRKCKSSRGEYHDFANETQMLHNTLLELKDHVNEYELDGRTIETCAEHARQCKELLEEMQREVDRYASLSTNASRVSDRLGWDSGRAAELRRRLATQLTGLSTFYSRLTCSHLAVIERALRSLLADYRHGRRDASSVASLTAVGDENDKIAWPQIVQDLGDHDIGEEVANRNREFIVNWYIKEIHSDGLELEPSESISTGAETSRPTSEATLITIPPQATPASARFLDVFGETGRRTDADVRRGANSFIEDLNRAHLFWERQNWAEVINSLLRLLAASLLQTHRSTYIQARRVAFLLGVAHSFSGDLEQAKNIMLTVLEPYEQSGPGTGHQALENNPSDDAHFAAAAWLGDICLKLNQVEDAAMAWSIAIHAAQRRIAQSPEQNRQPSGDSTTLRPARARSISSIGAGPHSSVTQRYVAKANLRLRLITAQLDLANQKLQNFDSLESGVYSGEYPRLAEPESVFSTFSIMDEEQMGLIVGISAEQLYAVANDPPAQLVRRRTLDDDEVQPSLRLREVQTALAGDSDATSLPIPALDSLQPFPKPDWPLCYDAQFSCNAAIHVIKWYDRFASLRGEGVAYQIPQLDGKASRTHDDKFGKPLFSAKNTNPNKLEHVKRYIGLLDKLLNVMNIDYREAPAELRCRAKRNEHARAPGIASFALKVINYRAEGLVAKPRLAVYLCQVMHWNGEWEEKRPLSEASQRLMASLTSTIQLIEFQYWKDRSL